jgi:putative transposase
MYVHLVFVTKFRHRVFTDAHPPGMEEIMRLVCAGFDGVLVEFNGEDNHVHLLVNSSAQGRRHQPHNSPKGVSSRRLRQEFPDLARYYWRAGKPWSRSYFARTNHGSP